MGRFVDWLQTRKPQIRKLIDLTFNRLRQRSGLLDSYFPLQNYDDFKLLWLRMLDEPAIASVVGINGEIPTTRRGKISEVELDTFKLAISHLWLEDDFKLMHELETRLAAGDARFRQTIANLIFGSVQDLPPRIVDLSNLLTWQVLTTGGCNYTDPRTDVIAKLEYDVVPAHFPAALTGTAVWSDAANANGLQNLVSHAEAVYATLGYFPDATAMSRKALNWLLAQQSTKNAAVSRQMGNPGASSDYVVSREMVGQLFLDREIPPLVVYDEQYTEESAAGVKTRKRFLPEDTYSFLTRVGSSGNNLTEGETAENAAMSMGERAWGPVVSNDMRPGIYTFEEELSKEPPKDRAVGVGTFVPAVWDSRTLAARKIN